MKRLAYLLGTTWLVTGCFGGDEQQEEPPPPVPPLEVTAQPYRYWGFFNRFADGTFTESPEGGGEQTGGEVKANYDFGGLTLVPPGLNDVATGEVYANASGTTYWVDTEAPIGNSFIPTDRIGGDTFYVQRQDYRKNAANATLTLSVTEAQIEALDFNGIAVNYARCPWAEQPNAEERCFDGVLGKISMVVILYRKSPTGEVSLDKLYSGGARLSGRQDNWTWQPFTTSNRSIFRENHFEFEYVNSSSAGSHVGARIRLRQPVNIAVDLSDIPLNSELSVVAALNATSDNRRGRESYIGARLRDPVTTGGTTIQTTGLEALNTPSGAINLNVEEAAPACSAASTLPQAGTVGFSSASYLYPEFGSAAPVVFVTREGGSEGQVVVTANTSDGSGVAGAHYTPVSRTIVFGDGDAEPRAVELQVANDDTDSGDRTVNLSLAAASGCATLGDHTDAVLTIVDDEHRAPTNLHSVGGTVTGLQGTGLVLREMRASAELTPTNGDFTFDYDYPDGHSYEVRVITQPENPRQNCSVAAASGVIASADVSNVAVTCVTLSTGSGLDPTFGEGGRVTSGLTVPGRALALQSNGKILALSERNLARFNTDGTVDTTFGTGGVVTVSFQGTNGEEAKDLVVQADDKIVVVGRTRIVPTTLNYDFAIARYEANGAVDASFGAGGWVNVDFRNENDNAYRVALQGDGKILVAGHAALVDRSVPSPVQNILFAAVRLNTDGSVDTSFAGDGKAEALGAHSLAYALVLQPDGKVLLGGRTGADGAGLASVGLARFNPDGGADTDTDSDPLVWFGEFRDGRYIEDFYGTDAEVVDLVIGADGGIYATVQTIEAGGDDYKFTLVQFDSMGRGFQATVVPISTGDDVSTALTVQPDGKFVVAGFVRSATVTDFGLVRFNTDRSVDTTFGTNGILTVDFFGAADGANDIIVQPDGKLLVLGTARNGNRNGMGLVRILP